MNGIFSIPFNGNIVNFVFNNEGTYLQTSTAGLGIAGGYDINSLPDAGVDWFSCPARAPSDPTQATLSTDSTGSTTSTTTLAAAATSICIDVVNDLANPPSLATTHPSNTFYAFVRDEIYRIVDDGSGAFSVEAGFPRKINDFFIDVTGLSYWNPIGLADGIDAAVETDSTIVIIKDSDVLRCRWNSGTFLCDSRNQLSDIGLSNDDRVDTIIRHDGTLINGLSIFGFGYSFGL